MSYMSPVGTISSDKKSAPRFAFSIVIPCHNEEKYITKLLQALETQRFPIESFEVIVVDNNSLDNTTEVIWRYAENTHLNLRMIHERRLGVSTARNTGAKNATGNMLIFLDADNLVTPHFLNDIDDLIKTTNCIAGTIRVLPDTNDLKGEVVFWTLELIKYYLRRPFGKSFVRKDIFDKVNGYDEKIALGENVDFLVRVKKEVRANSAVFNHVRKPIFCSLRRFSKQGYVRVLLPWLLAYVGVKNLRYLTMASFEKN